MFNGFLLILLIIQVGGSAMYVSGRRELAKKSSPEYWPWVQMFFGLGLFFCPFLLMAVIYLLSTMHWGM